MDMPVDTRVPLAVQIGMRLRSHRKSFDFTMAHIAAKMNTTPQTVQRLEVGTMTLSVDWVEKYCDALGIKPSDLFKADDVNLRKMLIPASNALGEIITAASTIKGKIDTLMSVEIE